MPVKLYPHIITKQTENQIRDNIIINAFDIAVLGSYTFHEIQDGIVDVFNDLSGIDQDASSGYSYANGYLTTESGSGGIDDYTKLLLHLNENYEDSSFSNHTVSGTAEISSDVYKFGSGSAYFENTYLIVEDSEDWDFGTGPFTVDFWANFQTVDNEWRTLVDINGHLNGTILQYYQDYGFRLWIAGEYRDYSYTPSISEWIHIEYSRDEDGYVRFFINGSQIGTDWQCTNEINDQLGVNIGRLNNESQYWHGYIDEFRISKGIARHTSNFDVPQGEYTVSSEATNMTVESVDITADFEPIESRIIIRLEDVDSVNLNEDFKAYVRKGETWNESVLSETQKQGEARIVTSDVILSGTGDVLRYKLTSHNKKRLRVHSVGLLWK